ncbi:MAG: twin-arginine translocation signal domain-containing protein [Thermoguttaceae bacterium]|nr:twin-arginine translocation signal domain-containing protein [Thermoguttaceae bacterium]
MRQINRRDFLRASAFGVAGLALSSGAYSFGQAAPQKRWYKGNLHTHNQWSDGSAMPETAVDWYKSHGYNFLCPSDHNIFQSSELRFTAFGTPDKLKDDEKSAFAGENSFWKPVSKESGWAKLTQKSLDVFTQKFGADALKTIEVGGVSYVRMTPFDELAAQFCEPEKFLMIPGFEQTGGCQEDGRQVHMNFINVRETFPYINAATPFETLTRTYEKGAEFFAGQNYLFTANHPLWRYYDFSPSDLIKMPQCRVFELLNNGIDGKYVGNPIGWNPEKFWDVVNAWRASHDQRLLLGMGSDDNHGFAAATRFSLVRAEKLEWSALLAAIDAGDVVASTGLWLDDVKFDGKTLEVKLDVREEGNYRIDFIGTKKDYDATCKEVRVDAGDKNPARTIETYSDEIGVVLETVEGTEGAYTLKADDLYVRARVYKVGEKTDNSWRKTPAVWTQPYRG